MSWPFILLETAHPFLYLIAVSKNLPLRMPDKIYMSSIVWSGIPSLIHWQALSSRLHDKDVSRVEEDEGYG